MWKNVGACCLMLATPALWGACTGDTFVDPTEKLPCDSSDECPQGTYDESQCVGGKCECPDPDEEFCCDPGASVNACHGRCRPSAECRVKVCETADDCPKPVDPRCGEASCDNSGCRQALRDQLEHQASGDCKVITCDETGKTNVEAADDDVFNDGNECTIDACVAGEAVHVPKERGPSGESSGRCDGNGRLVECNFDNECGNVPSIACSKQGRCVPEWCTNGIPDVGETALDCGGPCDPCPGGQRCRTSDDCQDRLCIDNKCAIASCHDGILNGVETDIDCGAPSCPACDVGASCNAHEACKSSVCKSGVCMKENCTDGTMNGNETGVDCGADCAPCPLYSRPVED